MDLLMQRVKSDETGVYYNITTFEGVHLFVAATHAYPQQDGSWAGKTPPGQYVCQLGNHLLDNQEGPFLTYQILNVPEHSGILFHKGNLPDVDSEGCFLLGTELGELNGVPAVLNSVVGFSAFMNLQQGVSQFNVTIS